MFLFYFVLLCFIFNSEKGLNKPIPSNLLLFQVFYYSNREQIRTDNCCQLYIAVMNLVILLGVGKEIVEALFRDSNMPVWLPP